MIPFVRASVISNLRYRSEVVQYVAVMPGAINRYICPFEGLQLGLAPKAVECSCKYRDLVGLLATFRERPRSISKDLWHLALASSRSLLLLGIRAVFGASKQCLIWPLTKVLNFIPSTRATCIRHY